MKNRVKTHLDSRAGIDRVARERERSPVVSVISGGKPIMEPKEVISQAFSIFQFCERRRQRKRNLTRGE